MGQEVWGDLAESRRMRLLAGITVRPSSHVAQIEAMG